MPTGIYPRPTDEERFFSYVDWQNPTEKGCWLWTGVVDHHGYGMFRWGGWDSENRRHVRSGHAHRFVWEWAYGPIDRSHLVLHKCDVRLCCNYECLFLGSPASNTKDMLEKGRQAKGEDLPQAVLTEEIVKWIIDSYSTGLFTQQQLAAATGVKQGAISKIVRRERWKHVKA